MRRLAKRGKLTQVYKDKNIIANQANGDEGEMITWKKDPSQYGTDEKNIERRFTPTANDYIVHNEKTPWQQYPVDAKTLNKKYYRQSEDSNTYIPKGEDMLASPSLRRGVHFKPKNWGGYEANVDKGGRMMQSTVDSSDIYPIQGKDFNSTYAKDDFIFENLSVHF